MVANAGEGSKPEMNGRNSHTFGTGEAGLVSVVIPTYNRAYILGHTIESVLQQSYQQVEVVVVDDGSTDETRSLVEKFGPPVRYLYQTNAGVSAARNHGLRESKGEFVALLDSDDKWLCWKLAAQVQLMDSYPDVGMIWTDLIAVDGAERILHPAYIRKMYSNHRRVHIEDICSFAGRLGDLCTGIPPDLSGKPFYHGQIFSEMILGSLVHTSTVLLRRTRLSKVYGFDESITGCGEDYEFHLNTCFHGPVGFLDAASILYRVGEGDQITGPRFGVQAACNNLVAVKRWLAKGKEGISLSEERIRQHLAECYDWIGGEKYVAGDFSGARAAQLQSLRIHPMQPRLWLHFAYHFLPAFIRRSVRTIRSAIARPSLNISQGIGR